VGYKLLIYIIIYLLVKEGPEDGERKEHDQDPQHQSHILYEGAL
jgi:hypothetical protein